MIITGTNHFVNRACAIGYYALQGLSATDVDEKIRKGEIHLGRPATTRGQTLRLVDGYRRWAIVEGGTR